MKNLDILNQKFQYQARVAKQSPVILVSSILVGLGTWGADHAVAGWGELIQPQHLFSLVGVVGAVLLGYFGGRPAKVGSP